MPKCGVSEVLMVKKKSLRKKCVVFEDIVDRYIGAEDRGLTPSLPLKNNGADVSRRLNAMRLAEIRKCSECKFNPVILLTKKKIPVCAEHWSKLADAQIGWSENE